GARLQCVGHAALEKLGSKRFGYLVDDVGELGILGKCSISHRRADDHGNPRGRLIRQQLATDLVAGGSRKLVVQHNQVRAQLTGALQPFFGRRGQRYPVTCLRQVVFDHLADGQAVVDHKNEGVFHDFLAILRIHQPANSSSGLATLASADGSTGFARKALAPSASTRRRVSSSTLVLATITGIDASGAILCISATSSKPSRRGISRSVTTSL